MLNPPYGERIEVGGKARVRGARESAEDRATPSDFFARLAAHWKQAYTGHPAGWTAWILSPDMRLPSAMRLKESRRVPMWNGPIECRLFRFDLVAGSAGVRRAARRRVRASRSRRSSAPRGSGRAGARRRAPRRAYQSERRADQQHRARSSRS